MMKKGQWLTDKCRVWWYNTSYCCKIYKTRASFPPPPVWAKDSSDPDCWWCYSASRSERTAWRAPLNHTNSNIIQQKWQPDLSKSNHVNMIVNAPHSQVRQHGTKTCHIHGWNVGDFLQVEINPKLHQEIEYGRKEEKKEGRKKERKEGRRKAHLWFSY